MAFIPPMLPYLAAAGTAGMSLLQFGQQRSAGRIAAIESESQAKLEEVAAIQREADRKSQLVEALASQNAYAGASGIAAFEGSPLAVMEENIRREHEATERDVFQSRLSTLTSKARGKVAKQGAYGRSLITLGQGLTQSAQLYPLKSKEG